MERLTKAEAYKEGTLYHFPTCFERCGGEGCKEETCDFITSVCDKLGYYEDLEEQGLLLKLPCKIGADVYSIPSKVNYDLNVLSKHKENNRVYHQKIANIVFTKDGWYMSGHLDMEYGTGRIFLDKFYKETWFLTKAEAEKTLAEMEK